MQSETREFWTKFNYPEDRDRVPLITPDGAAYPHEIRGVFRRKGFDLIIRTNDGREITATMSKWTLAEADLDRLGGYVVHDTGKSPSEDSTPIGW